MDASGAAPGDGNRTEVPQGLRFVKMHGAGNDYVYVDTFDQQVKDPARLSIAISDRHLGVGSDGLILVRESRTADARMEMYNADGSRGKMCGNGIRCVAKFLFDRGRAAAEMVIETDSGMRRVAVIAREGVAVAARVAIGVPEFDPRRIGLAAPLGEEPGPLLERPIEVEGQRLCATILALGNPHAVLFVDDLERVPVASLGPAIEHHPWFPERINVSFVQCVAASQLRQRTWERGSGETLACGTGATAGAVAAIRTGRAASPVTVSLPGGELTVDWRGPGREASLTGPAVEVYQGAWPLR